MFNKKRFAVLSAFVIPMLFAGAGFSETTASESHESHHPAATQQQEQPQAPADDSGRMKAPVTGNGMIGNGMMGGAMMGGTMHRMMHNGQTTEPAGSGTGDGAVPGPGR